MQSSDQESTVSLGQSIQRQSAVTDKEMSTFTDSVVLASLSSSHQRTASKTLSESENSTDGPILGESIQEQLP